MKLSFLNYTWKINLIPFIVFIAVLVLLLRLGFWQLDRADVKRAHIANSTYWYWQKYTNADAERCTTATKQLKIKRLPFKQRTKVQPYCGSDKKKALPIQVVLFSAQWNYLHHIDKNK
jgi:hypothetical protein